MATYWLLIFGRLGSRSVGPGSGPSTNLAILPETVFVFVFGFFLVLAIFRFFSIFAMPFLARPQDADILFPTPISPKAVLGHRLIFAYLGQLLLPILILVFAGVRGRSSVSHALANFSAEQMAQLKFTLPLGYMLLTAFLIAVNYSIGLSINQDNAASRRRLKVASLALYSIVAILVGVSIWIGTSADPWSTALAASKSDTLRLIFFPISGPALFATAPLSDAWTLGWMGLASTVMLTGILLATAFRQAHRAYDMSARRLAGEITALGSGQRPQAGEALVLQRIRGGKKKPWRISWLEKARFSGARALVWSQLLCSLRSTFGISMIALVAIVSIVGVQAYVGKEMRFMPALVLGIALMLSNNLSVALGLETTSRLDLKRSLPIKPRSIIVAQSVGSLLPFIVPSFLLIVLASIFFTDGTLFLVAPLLAVSSLSGSFAQSVSAMFFPDPSDPTQTGMRAIVMMLTLLFVVGPPCVIFTIGVAVEHSFWGFCGAALYSAIVGMVCLASATSAYSKFSPTET
jgi:hypothetical protein